MGACLQAILYRGASMVSPQCDVLIVIGKLNASSGGAALFFMRFSETNGSLKNFDQF